MRAIYVVICGVAVSCVVSASARAERVLVLPVSVDETNANDAVAAANALRAAIAKSADVVDPENVRLVFQNKVHPAGKAIDGYKARVEEAERALASLEQEKSLEILEGVIRELSADPDFTSEKQVLLERWRQKLAARLMGLAGSKETGRAETPYGKRARGVLLDALRTNPKLAPSHDEFPPRFFVAIDGARDELHKLGTGGLNVDSTPRGATVLVEGRNVGTTPLLLGNDVLARGSYRMWLEAGDVTTPARVVQVGARTTPVVVDMTLEGALWVQGAGLHPFLGTAVDERTVAKVGRWFDVGTVVLVGATSGDQGSWLWTAIVHVANEKVVRHGSTQLSAAGRVDDAAATLAGFVLRNETGGISNRPLPALVLPEPVSPEERALTAAGIRRADDFPWLIVVSVATGALLVAGGVVGAVLLTPKDGTLLVNAEDLP